VKCHLLGVVLNAVDANAPDYYYSYRYYPYSEGDGPQESGNRHGLNEEHSAGWKHTHYSDDMILNRYKFSVIRH
jgi:hypothetical protein